MSTVTERSLAFLQANFCQEFTAAQIAASTGDGSRSIAVGLFTMFAQGKVERREGKPLRYVVTRRPITVELCKQGIESAAKACIGFERGAQLAEANGDADMATSFRKAAEHRSAEGFQWGERLRAIGSAP